MRKQTAYPMSMTVIATKQKGGVSTKVGTET